MKKPITYTGNCGCFLGEDATVYEKHRPRVCRVHGEIIESGYRECLDCDTIIKLKMEHNGLRGSFRCGPCKTAWVKEKRHNKYIENSMKGKDPQPETIDQPQLAWSIDFRGDYCIRLSGCMKAHTNLPCADCNDYRGIFRWHDPSKLEQFTI